MDSRFSVYVRIRPLIREDISLYKKTYRDNESPPVCTQCFEEDNRIYLVKPYYDDRQFNFDKVVPPGVSQEQAYTMMGHSVVQEVLSGYNGTMMAYGQTGSGKTFTVFGSRRAIEVYGHHIHEEAGIIPRAVSQIFEYIRENIEQAQFQVTMSFLQIYMENIVDLLNFKQTSKGGLQIREDPRTGIFVNGLTTHSVQSEAQVMELIREAAKARSTSATSMNKTSSRSHAVLQVFLEQRWIQEGPPKKRRLKKGLLTIVDLAGSERLSKSGSEGLRMSEVKNINKSISALGNCVAALSSEAAQRNMAHVPFRDSKLTRLLTDSLGGNSKTCLYACVGPSLLNYDQTFSTLLFAKRAMKVKTYAKLNEKVDFKTNEPTQGVIQRNNVLETDNAELRQELDFLRMKLREQAPSPIYGEMSPITNSMLQECRCDQKQRELVSKFTHMIQYLQGEIARLNIVIANIQNEKGEINYEEVIEKLLTVPELRKKVIKYLR